MDYLEARGNFSDPEVPLIDHVLRCDIRAFEPEDAEWFGKALIASFLEGRFQPKITSVVSSSLS